MGDLDVTSDHCRGLNRTMFRQDSSAENLSRENTDSQRSFLFGEDPIFHIVTHCVFAAGVTC